MPLSKYRKRCYNRASRYGPTWRQVYYDNDGMCDSCQSPHDLEFHEELVDEGIKLRLVCRDCHIHKIHGNRASDRLGRKYSSMLAQDISTEIQNIGGLENWKKLYRIKETARQ